ncbi:hypothetical protein BJX64DRAFT_246262 [Aspergillus heterothallicus]
MSADQLLYPMDFSDRQEEWLDLDSLLQLPAGFVDSQPTSVESISPRDLDQSFAEVDFQNWDCDPALFSQAMFPEIEGFGATIPGLGQPQLDSFQHFVDPNEVLQPIPSQAPMFEASFDGTWVTDVPSLEPYPSFRHMVESQAALDTRCFSKKEKRRDASIALHMQRLQSAPLADFSSLPSHTQLSSPDWSVSSLDAMPSEPYTTPGTSPVSESLKSPSPSTGAEPGAASMQLVLDLNMNTTTNVPRKQKPRSRAQRENYIKARKYGVCEKHRKQHKRCNCLEKAAAACLTPTTPASATLAVIPGSRTNHERVISRTTKSGSGQGHVRSTNTGQPRPLVWQSTKSQDLGISVLQDQQSVSPTGHDRPVAATARSPTAGGSGSLNTSALYRNRDSSKQSAGLRSANERPHLDFRQGLPQSVDSLTKSQQPQTSGASQGALSRHRNLRHIVESPTEPCSGTLRVIQATLNKHRSLGHSVGSPTEIRSRTARVSQSTLSVHRNLHRTMDSPTETNTSAVFVNRAALNTRSQGDTNVRRTSCVSRGLLNTTRQRPDAAASAIIQTQQPHAKRRGAQHPQNAQNIHIRQAQTQGQRLATHWLSSPLSSLGGILLGGLGLPLANTRPARAGLTSLWQGSAALSSWAGLFLRRFAVFSSGILIASRKGMGFL